jgi:D-inositol-3-phosphate glycosyltransferase
MRVAMVSEHASPLAALGSVDAGGQNVHVAELAVELGRRGVEVLVYTRKDDATLPNRVPLAPNVSVAHVEAGPQSEVPKDLLFPYMAQFAGRLAFEWAADPPDVVHSHFWMSGWATLAATRHLGLPVVHTFHALGAVKRRHQGTNDTSPPQRIATEASIMGRASHIVATCSDEVFELVRLGADRNRVSVVPCGVDVDFFAPDGPAEPRTEGLARVVVVTRLVERKGIGNVVAAIAQLPRVELLVAGGGDAECLEDDPEAQRLRALALSLGVADRVHLLGRVARERIPKLLRSADVVVCAPWYEPFGIVPLEAMACGRPLVASAVGGMIDTVVHGVTGLHVPPRRPDRIAEALRTLLADSDLCARLGAAGVARTRNRYTWQRVADGTLRVYHSLPADVVVRREGVLT